MCADPVRDLAWVLGSAPLVAGTFEDCRWLDTAWSTEARSDSAPLLTALTDDPAPLHVRLQSRRSCRLGHYFETLLAFWLENQTRYELLAHDLPVRDASRTLGEFDFIVRDHERGVVQHWEVALKFYLGFKGAWLGPGLRDRLDRKLTHISDHQCRLSLLPAGAATLTERGLIVDERCVLLKGRLFYPVDTVQDCLPPINPAHERGFWIAQQAFASWAEPDSRWQLLARSEFLAPVCGYTGIAPKALLQQLTEPFTQPMLIAQVCDGLELRRGFIVPNNWPNTAPPSNILQRP